MDTIESVLSVFFIFLIFVYSSWIALFFYSRRRDINLRSYPKVSIIIPAHNEGRYIKNTLENILTADYPSPMEVIVVNDGSTDNTREIIQGMSQKDPRVRILDVNHGGKSNAINQGAEKAKNEILVVLDADSIIKKDALREIVKPLGKENVAAVSGVIRAVITRNPLTWFQDFEYVIGSAWRHIYNNIDSTYILPVFVAIRKKALLKIGGFGTTMLSEDLDVDLRLRKAGYELTMSKATIYTKVPLTLTSLVKQRIRWGRGVMQAFRKHRDMPFNPEYGAIGFYGIPLQIYWFIHGLFVTPITLYQVFDGYLKYFVAYNNILSFNVFKYFFGWVSAYGMVEYTYNTLTGQYPMTVFFLLVVTTFLLNLIYNLLAITKFSTLHLRHLIVLFFFFPYSVLVLTINIIPALH